MSSRGQATKEKLISTAGRLFRNQGYVSTSIEDICLQSGVKRGNLYFYFKSKEELALATLETALDRYMDYFELLIQDEVDPLPKIQAILDGIASYHYHRHCKPG